MIEKRIFYLWCGSEKPVDVETCIMSWRQHLPDYELIEIKENDKTWFDFNKACSENNFFDFVYKNKIWAYVADYVRFCVLEKFGGIWLDTDVQVLKSFDNLLDCKVFLGRENNNHVETAVIGAEAHHPLIKSALDFYTDNIWHSSLYTSPRILSNCLEKYNITFGQSGLLEDNGIKIYPPEYFYPLPLNTQFTEKQLTPNSYAIHWWKGSWSRPEVIFWLKNKHKIEKEKSLKINLEPYFRIYLFGFLKTGKFFLNKQTLTFLGIPVIKIKKHKQKKTAYLFGFIPLLKWK